MKRSLIQIDGAAYVFRKYARLGLDSRPLAPFEVYAVIRGVSKGESDALKHSPPERDFTLLSVPL